MATRDEIVGLVTATVDVMTEELKAQLNIIASQLQQLQIKKVETYEPVSLGGATGMSLDLIKSLPEFKGDLAAYPAWREAAHFAINYYKENTEPYYIAMGIFRNKIVGTANDKLSAFNTILNFKAIIVRLDQCFADKRSVQVLENELSILRQGKLSINEFYDEVDKHLTLIINKNKMTYSNNEEVSKALNERVRENALRIFISGLRKPLSDVLFSTKPSDLPTALATAQELESDNRRQEFARVFAERSIANKSKPSYSQNSHPIFRRIAPNAHKSETNKQDIVQTEVDPGSSMFRRPTAFNSNNNRNAYQNNTKREWEVDSGRSAPLQKQQRVNHINAVEESEDSTFEEDFPQDEDDEDHVVEELHFLE